MTLPTAEDAGTAQHSDRVIACLADGRHLFIVYGGLLDNDIQPANEDFSVKIKGKNAHIKAAQLRSPLQAGSAWSVITLLADRALPTTTEVTVSYHPIQWLLCSQGQEEPVDPFELSTRLLDGAALAGCCRPGRYSGYRSAR